MKEAKAGPDEMTLRLVPAKDDKEAKARLKLFDKAKIPAEPGDRDEMSEIVIPVDYKDEALELLKANKIELKAKSNTGKFKDSKRKRETDEAVEEAVESAVDDNAVKKKIKVIDWNNKEKIENVEFYLWKAVSKDKNWEKKFPDSVSYIVVRGTEYFGPGRTGKNNKTGKDVIQYTSEKDERIWVATDLSLISLD